MTQWVQASRPRRPTKTSMPHMLTPRGAPRFRLGLEGLLGAGGS